MSRTPYVDWMARTGVEYCHQVRATNRAGVSLPSPQWCVTPKPSLSIGRLPQCVPGGSPRAAHWPASAFGVAPKVSSIGLREASEFVAVPPHDDAAALPILQPDGDDGA